jgi:hypothetical protein
MTSDLESRFIAQPAASVVPRSVAIPIGTSRARSPGAGMTHRKIRVEILRDLFVIAVLLAVFVVVLIYLVGY